MARRPFEVPGGNNPRAYGGFDANPTGPDQNDPYGRSGAQQARDRYRALGDPRDGLVEKNPAVALQFGKAEANEAQSLASRGQQTDALGQLRNAAQGNAPSEAAVLGNAVAGQSIQDAMRAQGGARTAAAQGAAGSNAIRGMQATQQAGIGGYAGMRSGEIGSSLDQYNSGAGAIRTQDYGNQGLAQQRADEIAKNELANRDLQQRRQMGYERLAYGATADDLANNVRMEGLATQSYLGQKQREADSKANNMADAGAAMSVVGKGFGLSDKRSKNVLPPSALAKLADQAKGRIASAKAGLDQGSSVTERPGWAQTALSGEADRMREDGVMSPTNRDVEQIRFGGAQDSNVSRGDVNEMRFGDRRPDRGHSQGDVDEISKRPFEPSFSGGPQKAPTGYAESRRGQPGGEGGPVVTHGFERMGADKAPGSDDWSRYGAPGKTRKDDYGFDPTGRMLYGPDTNGSDMKRVDPYSAAISFSDERTKKPADLGTAQDADSRRGVPGSLYFGSDKSTLGFDEQKDPRKWVPEPNMSPQQQAMGYERQVEDFSRMTHGKKAPPPLPFQPPPLFALSDENAKRSAFLDGLKFGKGQTQDMPSYMPKQSAATSHAKAPDTVGRMNPEAQAKGRERAERAQVVGRAMQGNAVALGMTGNPVAWGLAGGQAGGASAALEHQSADQGERYKIRQPQDFKRTDTTPLPSSPVEGPSREESLRQIPVQPDKDEQGPYASSDERTKNEAALALESKPYTYKDEFLPGEQDQGEVNYGPMAQQMEKNPITATAVKKDPRTGMRMVDMMKLTKVHSGLIADLRKDINGLRFGKAGS